MLERREVLDNPSAERIRRIAELSRRSSRLKRGLVRIEGAKAVCEALRFSPGELIDVYVTRQAASSNPELLGLLESTQVYGHFVSERVAKVAAEASQGWFAVARFGVFPALRELSGRLSLILPEVQDPGNVGTLIRLADACGAGSVFVGQGTADPACAKVIRASVGSVFHVPVPRFEDLGQLVDFFHQHEWLVVGTALGASLQFSPMLVEQQFKTKKVAWVVGNEAHGLSRAQQEICDVVVSIPMYGQTESFNVTQAATLALWLTANAQSELFG